MSEYDRQIIGRQAAGLGFTRDAFEKVYRLAELLAFLESSPVLSRYLALKGGTAINLTVFSLPRLSVDIDLDFAENLSLAETEETRKAIILSLSQYMDANGYQQSIVKSKRYHTLDSLVYLYTNAGRVQDNIKVEINYSLRSHVLPFQTRPIETLGVFSPARVLALDPIELFAAKTAALLSRAAPRDLYDLNNMVYFGLFDETQAETLRKCIVFYLAVAGDTVPEKIDLSRMEAITPYKVKTDLNPVIRKQERFDLAAAQKRVREYLSGLLALTTDERQFLSAFREKEYRPELLFEEDMLDRVKNHPMAMWKMQDHSRRRDDRTL